MKGLNAHFHRLLFFMPSSNIFTHITHTVRAKGSFFKSYLFYIKPNRIRIKLHIAHFDAHKINPCLWPLVNNKNFYDYFKVNMILMIEEKCNFMIPFAVKRLTNLQLSALYTNIHIYLCNVHAWLLVEVSLIGA